MAQKGIVVATGDLILYAHMLATPTAELALQISLLAEHEVAQLVNLLDAVPRKLGVEYDENAELEEAKQDVEPRDVPRRHSRTRHHGKRPARVKAHEHRTVHARKPGLCWKRWT